jgi:hypothetical protein
VSLSARIIARFLGEFPKASQPAIDRLRILIDEEGAKVAKERKRAEIDERAAQILNVYPRRQGGEAGLTAISKAIAKDGFDKVLEGTTEYASAVARWSYARRVSQSGSSLIPLPATWFGNRCYLDDPKYWWEGTGKKDKEEKEAVLLAEPEGWRFAHPDNRFVTEHIAWSAIDTASQKWIIANTPQRQNTG